ncbi:PhnA domain-containing protein [Brucella tritici]|uniref:PhnA domain-containing protein n=1 Tax=Brucella tritici TaxID=94626 RepID=UPI003AF4078E
MAASSIVFTSSASGRVLTDQLITKPSKQSIMGDRHTLGAGQTLKQGTVIKSIRLTEKPEEVDCKHDTIKGLVWRTEFARKRG